MPSFNQKEYQTVILGALLHDIGKFLNRGEHVKRKHPLFSADYVNDPEFQKLIKDDWIDLNLLKILVQRHHEYPKFPSNLLVQTIPDMHTRALAYIISRADNYSSGERLDEEPSELDFKKARLMSVLSRVKNVKGDEEPLPHFYNLSRLSPSSAFPVPEAGLSPLTHDYDKLLATFGKAFKTFKPKNFNALFNSYHSLFEEFLWCVPSDTRDRFNDISLYDHLSTTSAIAACLYQYHCGDFSEESIKSDGVQKFMMVAGDLSGIQRFIFEIGTYNPKKLSKTLRGRSFYLSLLTETAALKIMRRLNLPLSCRIMNAGGRFVLLVPKTKLVEDAISMTKREIEKWFYRQFLGKLSLNIASGVSLSGNDFTPEHFSQINRSVVITTEAEKKRKFKSIVSEDGKLFKEVAANAYKEFQQNEGPCDFCQIYPKMLGKKRCRTCEDAGEIGAKISSHGSLYVYEGEEYDGIKMMGYTVSFGSYGDWVLAERFYDDKTEMKNDGYIRRHISRYIPTPGALDIDFKNEKPQEGHSLCRYCGSPCKVDVMKEGNKADVNPMRKDLVEKYLTFQCLAASTRRNNNGKGTDHLAVIKADVDDLGILMGLGLGDAFSISRYAGLSRMLDYFFTGWLPDEITRKFPMTYVVYAGGDDLLLIAPWEEALKLAEVIGMQFQRYVAANPNITISMGINLMRPGSPVRLATEGAEDNLEKSKESEKGKNCITLFETSVKWNEYADLKKLMEVLDKELNNDDTRVTMSFLYRLLRYHEMYLDFADKSIIEGLKFHSAMSRDVNRNIVRKDKSGKILNQDFIEKLGPLYLIGEDFNPQIMRNLKIPVFWTIYKNRGGGK